MIHTKLFLITTQSVYLLHFWEDVALRLCFLWNPSRKWFWEGISARSYRDKAEIPSLASLIDQNIGILIWYPKYWVCPPFFSCNFGYFKPHNFICKILLFDEWFTTQVQESKIKRSEIVPNEDQIHIAKDKKWRVASRL